MLALALLLIAAGFGAGTYGLGLAAGGASPLVALGFALAIAGAVALLFSPRLVLQDRPGFPRPDRRPR